MADNPQPDNRTELHEHLIAMRAELVERMASGGIEAGALALLAGINAAVEACDLAAEAPVSAALGERAIVTDDGRAITLTLYTEVGAVAAIALDPVRAVGLAARLIAAALPRLSAP